MNTLLLTLMIRFEHDVVLARQRAWQIAELLGLNTQDQTRIATAVSEMARNAFQYAGGGKVEYRVEGPPPEQRLVVRISDRGPGIADLSAIREGRYTSKSGMGWGLIGARRLMDRFQIESAPGRGTTVTLERNLPKGAPEVTAQDLARIVEALAQYGTKGLFEEVQRQNQELLRAMEELRLRQEELVQLNRELEDTNRGVVALYAELDEKVDQLRGAGELKGRFLSDMSHEFRTPLNSILALSQLLLDRVDGELTPEQEKQVAFVHKAAQDLTELVNDLLDIAKAESGKLVVHPTEFEVAHLFGALRGMMRPMLINPSVALIFEEPGDIPLLYTDEGKVSQILRNLISNALKFTACGEVRVSARLCAEGTRAIFSVTDTGIGIAPQDQARIFEEFAQLDSLAQRKVQGTGLGLPLSRRLAELLGGHLSMKSIQGVGSTFSAAIPLRYELPAQVPRVSPPLPQVDPTRYPVLVIEDNAETLFIYEKYLQRSGFQMIPAQTLQAGLEAMETVRPVAIVLDILLPGENAWEFLARMKQSETTRDIPILVVTILEDSPKGMALGADDYRVKPVDRAWLQTKLKEMASRAPLEKVLIIDDEEVSRYLLKGLLADTRYTVIEATSGPEGLRQASEEHPQVIFLDLIMPEMTGFEVLDRLKADPATRDIPVVIYSSKVLDEAERQRLTASAAVVAILSKEGTSPEATIAQIRDSLLRARAASHPDPGGSTHV